jgi:hypothetical protein
MTKPFTALLSTSFRNWIGAKGFWLVALAAIVPMILTGAWAGTHRAELAAGTPTWGASTPLEGQNITITVPIKNIGGVSVGAFNATVAVGEVSGNNFSVFAENSTRINGLNPGASKDLKLSWTAVAGQWYVFAQADTNTEIGQVDITHDQRIVPLAVDYPLENQSQAPLPQTNTSGNDAGAPIDLSVAVSPGGSFTVLDAQHTWNATVTNVGSTTANDITLYLRTGSVFGNNMTSVLASKNLSIASLGPGQSASVTVTATPATGTYWTQADVAPGTQHPLDRSKLDASVAYSVNPTVPPSVEPPASSIPTKATIKNFYLQVLGDLYLRLLIPFVALFYAAGIITDEKERGNLTYILTRPVDRWVVPVVKFVAGFAVAGIAIVIGVSGTYLILFQATPAGKDVGFFTTPLLASLLALFAYGSFFTVLGVFFERPYLWGVAYIIGWEAIVSNFVQWIGDHLSINHTIGTALGGWAVDQGVQWLPQGITHGANATSPIVVSDAVHAVEYLIVASFVFLVVAGYWMKKREFDV